MFCGGYHTFAITRGGDLYATGLNNYGQLGLGDNESRFKAEKVDAFGELQVARVAVRCLFSCLLFCLLLWGSDSTCMCVCVVCVCVVCEPSSPSPSSNNAPASSYCLAGRLASYCRLDHRRPRVYMGAW